MPAQQSTADSAAQQQHNSTVLMAEAHHKVDSVTTSRLSTQSKQLE
jgi:hypothetical protein